MAARSRLWCGAAVALMLAALAGCGSGGAGLFSGIYTAQDQGKSTAKHEYAFELIPNAMLGKEDTSPDWQLGRYVFMPGTQRLLVISRITSWSDRPKDEKDHPPMVERTLERLWITIPAGTPRGQHLDVEDLESKFLAGYDKGDIGRGSFIQPSTLKGTVTLLDDGTGTNTCKIFIHISTRPPEGDDIAAHGEYDVPIEPKGIHATPATEPNAVALGKRHLVAPTVAAPDGPVAPTTQKSADGSATPTTQKSTDGGSGAGAGDAGAKRLAEQTVVGKWETVGAAAVVKVQFDADGRYAVSLSSANETPTPLHVGTYHVSGDTLTFHLDRSPAEGGGVSSTSLPARGRWEGDKLVLEGSLSPGTPPITATLKPSNFATMKTRLYANSAAAQ